jgi:hypothetical protein
MRVRIIFRGLILFRFEKPSDPQVADDCDCCRGTATAWLISDPQHEMASSTTMDGATSTSATTDPMGHSAGGGGMDMDSGERALNVHVPRIAVYGRRFDPPTSRFAPLRLTNLKLDKGGETTFRLVSPGTPNEVTTTRGFDRYVPHLGVLAQGPRRALQPRFVVHKIILPHGRLRARDLLCWDDDPNRPAEVAFMGTSYRGFVANEAVLEIGDDNGDYDAPDRSKYLSIESSTPELPKQLWSLTSGEKYVDETDPNTAEILITNFAPQRRKGVFWSLHYQALFNAAGYTAGPSYMQSDVFKSFEAAARKFDEHEWESDKKMGVEQPFPYVFAASGLPFPPLEQKGAATMARELRDISPRRASDGLPEPLAVSDPWARPICPVGQDDQTPGI